MRRSNLACSAYFFLSDRDRTGVDEGGVFCHLAAVQFGYDEEYFHLLPVERVGKTRACSAQSTRDVRWEFPPKHKYFHSIGKSGSSGISGNVITDM